MGELRVRRGQRADAQEAVCLWQESFSADWAADALDLSGVRRVVQFLLSGRRLPLNVLHRLGSAAELWVAYSGDTLVGVMGQLGEQLPRLTGLVLRGELRGQGWGQAFVGAVLCEHDRIGTLVVRALPAREGWARRALVKLGFCELGDIWDYELSLPWVGGASETRPRWLRRRQRRGLVCHALRSGDLRRAVTLDGTYGAPLPSVLGLQEGIATESGGAVASVEYNVYQSTAQVRLCPPDRGDSAALVQGLASELSRRGARKLRVALWERDEGARQVMDRWGGELTGEWAWLARPRRSA